MPSCLTVKCDAANYCVFSDTGGCVPRRFGGPAPAILDPRELKDNARVLAGTTPRPSRDPHTIKRKRKALVP
jgi:hypothetical protein